jgi:hypothetical protein
MKNPEKKYIELILDLSYKEEFKKEIKSYRNKLGMPSLGFKSDKERNKFEDNISPNFFYEVEDSYKELSKRYSNNKKLLNQILQWKDLYENGHDLIKIIKKFNIPKRATFPLYLFIISSKSALDKNLQYFNTEQEVAYYGCDIECGHKIEENDFKDFVKLNKSLKMQKDRHLDRVNNIIKSPVVEKIKELKEAIPHGDYMDLSAVICIYPEAKKSDVIKLINDTWKDEIEPMQKITANQNNIALKNIRTKEFRNNYNKIYNLHKKGLSSREIAKRMNYEFEGSWEYVRKVISICRKREV